MIMVHKQGDTLAQTRHAHGFEPHCNNVRAMQADGHDPADFSAIRITPAQLTEPGGRINAERHRRMTAYAQQPQHRAILDLDDALVRINLPPTSASTAPPCANELLHLRVRSATRFYADEREWHAHRDRIPVRVLPLRFVLANLRCWWRAPTIDGMATAFRASPGQGAMVRASHFRVFLAPLSLARRAIH